MKFLDKLKNITLKLKEMPIEERQAALFKRLQIINIWIDADVRSHINDIKTDCKYNYMGIVMPFEEGDDVDPTVIMRILPELSQPFNTKKRAPIKVVFETVKLSEIKLLNPDLHDPQPVEESQLLTQEEEDVTTARDNPFDGEEVKIGDTQTIDEEKFNQLSQFVKFAEYEEKLFEFPSDSTDIFEGHKL